MSKNTSRIGKDDEREIVKDLEKRGYRARRQPGSGNRAVDLQHDIVWESPAGRLHIESKWRKESQWKTLEGYRAGADILTLKCDGRMQQHSQRMVFMSWELFLDLVGEHQEENWEPSEQIWLPGGSNYTTEKPPKPKTNRPKRKFPKSRGFSKDKRALRS